MCSPMKALILAAGEGTRMRPLTANIPKPLLPVAGKPFLQHIIETLESLGIRDICLLIGWKDLKIKEYFADGITEEITSRLASLHGLGVISRTSAFYYKETKKTIRQRKRSYICKAPGKTAGTTSLVECFNRSPERFQSILDAGGWIGYLERSSFQ